MALGEWHCLWFQTEGEEFQGALPHAPGQGGAEHSGHAGAESCRPTTHY